MPKSVDQFSELVSQRSKIQDSLTRMDEKVKTLEKRKADLLVELNDLGFSSFKDAAEYVRTVQQDLTDRFNDLLPQVEAFSREVEGLG